MGERRAARRYEISLPVHVRMSGRATNELHTGHLRNISRTGVYFLLDAQLEPDAVMDLTFALPTEMDRSYSVLVRAHARAIRVSAVEGEIGPLYAVAASIDRLDFVRPVAAGAAA